MAGSFEVEWSDDCVVLLMLWNERVTVQLNSYSKAHIDIEVDDGQKKFRFIGIYGNCVSSRKQETWDLFDTLKGQSDLPWLVEGDMNEILDQTEKEGGRRRRRSGMHGRSTKCLKGRMRGEYWIVPLQILMRIESFGDRCRAGATQRDPGTIG
ncbi:hypothetical protein V6N13_008285 [Hibiscus sabdariffa]